MNESASYVDCGHWKYGRNKEVPAIPANFALDSRQRKNYLFGMMPPGITPRSAFESGFMVKASSLAELARACGIDGAGLERMVRRFNQFAAAGKDLDFHRGDSA